MKTPLETLLENLEEIAAYHKLHEKTGDYEDMRKVLDEYYEAIETPDFDFNMEWDSLGRKTKEKFIAKVKQIENDALNRISKEEKIDFEIVKENVTPLDPESEWCSFEVGCDLPADINWIEFEMDFFRGELIEKGIL